MLLTLEEALAQGYKAINVNGTRVAYEQRMRQHDYGTYGVIRDKTRRRRHYIVRAPGSRVVCSEYMDYFLYRVKNKRDAQRLARRLGEGTVIQQWTDKVILVRTGATRRSSSGRLRHDTFAARTFPTRYNFTKFINGQFVPISKSEI